MHRFNVFFLGPRLYKQPATKSNRGIMLNAVEYCVFPGAVNKEAKRRVRRNYLPVVLISFIYLH